MTSVRRARFECNNMSSPKANIPNLINDEISKFINGIISRDDISINRVILFGSYKDGTFHTWSDIDIAVVANWGQYDIYDRIIYLQNISIKEKCHRVQALGVTEKELSDNVDHAFYSNVIKGFQVYDGKINDI